jgi:hypothetical protein
VPHDYAREVNKGRGRLESWECWTAADPESLAFVREQGEWKNLRRLVMLRAERRIGNQRSVDTRYYISSLRHMALNLLKQEHSVKVAIKGERHKAGWDRDYLLKALQS